MLRRAHCVKCGRKTGEAGPMEDSIYVYPWGAPGGPLCGECREKYRKPAEDCGGCGEEKVENESP